MSGLPVAAHDYSVVARSVSLMDGWLPVVVQVLTVVALLGAIGWRTRRWRTVSLPALTTFGVVTAIAAHHRRRGRCGFGSDQPVWPPASR